MKGRILFLVAAILVVSVVGCRTKPERIVRRPYDQPLAPGENALRKVTDPLEIPDFTVACYGLGDLRRGIDNSLNYLKKPSSQLFFPCSGITHSQAVESLEEFAKLVDSGLTGRQLNEAIRDKFDVYTSVGCDNRGTVLFTGYYTPIFNGSEARTERFRYALYKQPEDLVKNSQGEILGRRGPGGQIEPYPPRAVLEASGVLEGEELVWLEDPFEAYIAHVQGSAKIRMPDGNLSTVGYAASNGHEYKSISKELVSEGRISRAQMSLSAMIGYFKHHAEQVSSYIRRNPRFVFFRNQSGQPRGSLNEPVISMRTIATDKSIFPRGCLTFMSTMLPRERGGIISKQYYSGFALDQDTGGAIRAAGRCDVYMGVGDVAGRLAGQTYQEGRLYYLFLKQSGPVGYY